MIGTYVLLQKATLNIKSVQACILHRPVTVQTERVEKDYSLRTSSHYFSIFYFPATLGLRNPIPHSKAIFPNLSINKFHIGKLGGK